MLNRMELPNQTSSRPHDNAARQASQPDALEAHGNHTHENDQRGNALRLIAFVLL
jgi:hypothetical protein